MALETMTILTQDRIDKMNAKAIWPKGLLLDRVERSVEMQPDGVAVTGINSMRGRVETVSYSQLWRYARRIAIGLADLGVGKGEVVSYQLPNWWEFAALHLACLHIGAITNPVMPIFRQRELSFMLDYAESKVFFAPKTFRNFDHQSMIEELVPSLPKLEHVFILDGEGGASFEAHFLERRWEEEVDEEALFTERRPNPNDIIEILYTSGTSGVPKGVLHTSNTLLSLADTGRERLGLMPEDVVFMPSPMAHQTGFVYGMLMAFTLGTKLVLQDIWSPEVAARQINDERCSYTMASTPFLADLANTPALDVCDVSSFRMFCSAGAPIPRILVETATERLGANILSGWGMTENGLVATTRPEDPPEKIFNTDGAAVANNAVRIVDSEGNPVSANTEGRLQAQSIGMFVGYLKRPDACEEYDGWFETGDLARMDEDGYIRIVGRAKDIIIRGGENIPVVEVEEMIYRHPAVEDVAVVAMPDERLGERGCAFVQTISGGNFTFDGMIEYLIDAGMAKTYLPERLEIIDEFPRTASGKIQKFELREIAKDFTV
ncbi:MAG: Short-chain-fatty-acid--CoA ligase [Alphaproteobacteria bacterium MarineAlpha4_Bin2]|nr:MAG: Short-chain-fatty-acid--CoA ligase [Alphaproteobacteria bacterium MarineAlpha4_Bin2]